MCVEKPYGKMNDLILSVKVADGYRPDTNADGSQQAPAGCPADLYTVMKSCWTKNPQNRPDFQVRVPVCMCLCACACVPVPVPVRVRVRVRVSVRAGVLCVFWEFTICAIGLSH